MEESVFDPVIPYISPIPEGTFRPGNAIKIQGSIPSSAYRFNIALQCGPETLPRDDVALLITIRLIDGYVSLNALQNGVWGNQVRGGTFTVKRGENFEIDFLCESKQYKVEINGEPYCVFPQLICYDRITHLAIDGDVSVVCISYESTGSRELIDEPEVDIGFPAFPAENELEIVKLIDGAPLPKLAACNKEGAIQNFDITEFASNTVNDGGNQYNSSKFETIDRYYWQKFCALFWCVIVCIVIIFAIVISQADERPIPIRHYNDTFNETYAEDNVTISSINGTYLTNNDV